MSDEKPLLFRAETEAEPIHYVDAAPDEGYVLRILEAHLHNQTSTYCTDNMSGDPPKNPLCIAMNEAADKRAELLRAAITKLREQNAI